MERFAIKIRTDINAESTLYVTLVCSYKSTAEDHLILAINWSIGINIHSFQ